MIPEVKSTKNLVYVHLDRRMWHFLIKVRRESKFSNVTVIYLCTKYIKLSTWLLHY